MIGITNHSQVLSYLKSQNVPRRKAKKRTELRETPPVGKSFGLWTIISNEIKVGKDRSIYWLCQCKCGKISWKKASVLKKRIKY